LALSRLLLIGGKRRLASCSLSGQNPFLHYRLFISEKARQQLRVLEKSIRRNIGYRMELMRDDLHGDVKKLEAKGNRYRLRIGSHRVLFTLEGDQIAVYAVKDRKEAYE
jgi:mRNA-degrading endonuclease RelE of RelBE toxin-antitoxin system